MPIGDQVGRGPDDVTRRLTALEQAQNALTALAGSAKAIAAAVQTGLGNLATSGTTWAGPVASPSTVTAVGAITGGPVTGSSVASSGTISSGSDATFNGILRVPSIYNNPITTSFRVVYTTSVDGQLGFNLSSAEFKQDIADYSIDVAAAQKLHVVTFRYIQAVEMLGDNAAVEVGLIAEEVHDLGLNWLVDYNEEGKPEGVKFDRLALASLALAQDHEKRLSAIEKKLGLVATSDA